MKKNIWYRWNKRKSKSFPIVDDFFFKLAISLVKTKRNTKKILIGGTLDYQVCL